MADATKSDKKKDAPADQPAAADAQQRQQVQVEDKDAFCSHARRVASRLRSQLTALRHANRAGASQTASRDELLHGQADATSTAHVRAKT